MTLPLAIVRAALPLKANVSRHFDSTGNHVAYSYRSPENAVVYRGTVAGMLALLRQVKAHN